MRSAVCFGLFEEDLLVAAMSFGVPRVKSHMAEGNWELLRFATLPNTLVVGAAGKLYKFFISNLNPKKVVSYCDLRFSSLNPNDTVYPKLGFKYDGQTLPNYHYTHPNMNRLFSRQAFQKWKLESKLEKYDNSLTEE